MVTLGRPVTVGYGDPWSVCGAWTAPLGERQTDTDRHRQTQTDRQTVCACDPWRGQASAV
eukprot:914793-Rhodomonas_salina.1